eukprot:TRINITY_DN2666_c0_g2_i4.p1 TRINITY_DN2666_c0_g2~~TRINITY_DN2666_c0_g2_i4.p1  ORF type:complete len:467 (-),score=91.83 TRINITY_DN2666_c0_g2_i4:111-1511(-)
MCIRDRYMGMRKMSLWILLLLLTSTVLSQTLSKMKVMSPKTLSTNFPNGIEFNIGNFGKVPYGKSLLGKLYLADPIDGCQPLTPIFHKESDPSNKKKNTAPFVLVERGGCDFVTKTHYAEIIGAKMVIVINYENQPSIVMGDDGLGNTLGIPSIIISYADGKQLKEKLNSKVPEEQTVTLLVKFDMPQNLNVEYMLWISSTHQSAYTFLERFRKFHNLFEGAIKIQPHYVLWYCYHCKFEGWNDQSNPNCISGGRYCAPDPDDSGPASGRQVVMEDLRQMCIFEKYPALWWDYMEGFGNTCLDEFQTTCYKRVLEAVGISNDVIEQCIKESFKGELVRSDNDKLEKERELFKNMNIPFWPALIINQVTYRGNLEDPEEVFDAICASFTKAPEICELYYNPADPSLWHYLSLVLIAVAVFGVFLYMIVIIYKKRLRKELSKQMESHITTAVSQYVAMKDMPATNEGL